MRTEGFPLGLTSGAGGRTIRSGSLRAPGLPNGSRCRRTFATTEFSLINGTILQTLLHQEGFFDGREGFTDLVHLLRGMGGADTAPKQAHSVRCGRRQHEVDVHTAFQEGAPEGDRLFLALEEGSDDRAEICTQGESQVMKAAIQPMRVLPQALA